MNGQDPQLESVKRWQTKIAAMPSLVSLCLEQLARQRHRLSVADSTGLHFSRRRLLLALLALAPVMKRVLGKSQNVGVCLPASVGAAVASLSVWGRGKTLVPLNYTTSTENILAAISQAEVSQVITSKRFIQRLKDRGINIESAFHDVELLFLEDLKKKVNRWRLPYLLIVARFFSIHLVKARFKRDKIPPAVILFSSGSEGKPKGIVLSQDNLIGNAKQAAEALQAKKQDVMVSVLPIFHVFGLTANMLLPLIEGIPMVAHPDPRDGVAIGHLVHQWKATILCGTSTFYRLYTRSKMLKPELFKSLRLVVAGAEKLQPLVRSNFQEKFGLPIYEGYGTSELSPVCAVNQPNWGGRVRNKHGTVGQAVPGCCLRIIDPDTNEALPVGEAGMIAVAGVNVMQEYLRKPDKTADVIFESDDLRWYKTGDKGVLDKAGFLTVLDRYSRFAKLAGEMVSLAALELEIHHVLNRSDLEILALSLPDEKKGEVIALLVCGDVDLDDLSQLIRKSEIPNLYKPHRFVAVSEIPKLASGKTDFAAAKLLL